MTEEISGPIVEEYKEKFAKIAKRFKEKKITDLQAYAERKKLNDELRQFGIAMRHKGFGHYDVRRVS